MARSSSEIENLIAEWEALRGEYAARGSTGIVDFINAEIRKLRAERDAFVIEIEPKPTA
jgi:hypothetical protein